MTHHLAQCGMFGESERSNREAKKRPDKIRGADID
jgi:hypothetical protein